MNSPIVIVLLLILVAFAAVTMLPAPVGWFFAAICLVAALALLVGTRGPRARR
jgi:hypothetical protein